MILTKYNNNNIIEFIDFDAIQIQDYLTNLGIFVSSVNFIHLIDGTYHVDLNDNNDLPNEFISSDFVDLTPDFITNFHYHNDDEARIVINGKIVIVIKQVDENCEYQLVLTSGDIIVLPAKTPHLVKALEQSTVMRLFSTNDDYLAIDYDIQHQ